MCVLYSSLVYIHLYNVCFIFQLGLHLYNVCFIFQLGLRTLVIGMRHLSQEEYEKFDDMLMSARKSLKDRSAMVLIVYILYKDKEISTIQLYIFVYSDIQFCEAFSGRKINKYPDLC